MAAAPAADNTGTDRRASKSSNRGLPHLGAARPDSGGQGNPPQFPCPGSLGSIVGSFETGLRVQAGEVIARLDPRPFDCRVRTSELNLASAKANQKEFSARLAAVETELRQAEAQANCAKLNFVYKDC